MCLSLNGFEEFSINPLEKDFTGYKIFEVNKEGQLFPPIKFSCLKFKENVWIEDINNYGVPIFDQSNNLSAPRKSAVASYLTGFHVYKTLNSALNRIEDFRNWNSGNVEVNGGNEEIILVIKKVRCRKITAFDFETIVAREIYIYSKEIDEEKERKKLKDKEEKKLNANRSGENGLSKE